MKALRLIAFIVGGLVVLGAIAVAIAFMPSVQTWAVRKAVAGQPGQVIEVGRVAAGFSSANISGLRVVKDGVVITVDQVTAQYSAWDYLSHKRINVDSAAVQGLVVDLRQPTPPPQSSPTALPPPARATASAPNAVTASSSGPSGFNGILSQAQLPFDVRIAKFSVEGKALLPGDKATSFTLQGQGIETGKTGTVSWKVDFVDPTNAAALASAQTNGTVSLHLTPDRRIDSLAVESTVSARGPNLPPDSLRFELKAGLPAVGGNEVYDIVASVIRQQKAEPLVRSHIEYQVPARVLAGTWDVTIATEQLATLLAGLGLPEIAAKGSGKFTFSPGDTTLSTTGDLQADISALEKLSPALATVGRMHIDTAFDANVAGNIARLNRLSLVASDAAARKIVEVTTLQAVSFDTTTQRVALNDPKAQLARISVQALPLAWAQSVAKPMVIESGDLSLVISVEADADGSRVAVKTVEPVTLRSVTVRNGDQKLVDQATFTLSPRIDYTPSAIAAELAGLKLSLPAGDALEGIVTARVTNLPAAPAVAFTAQLQGKVVSALKPYLPLDPGTLTLAISTEGQLEGKKLQLAKASAKVDRAAGGLLASLETQQSVAIDLESMAVTAARPDASIASVRIGEIPLAWAEGFVPKSKLNGNVAGGALELALRSPDELAVKTTTPFRLRGVSATIDQQVLAQNLDVVVDFSATKRGEVIGYDLSQAEIAQGNVSLAKLVVAGEAKLGPDMTVTAKGTLNADLATATKQPMLAGSTTLAQGTLATSFDVTTGKTIQAKASLKVSNLIAQAGNQPLGTLEANLDANVTPDGSGRLKLPVTLTANNRRSDITIDGTVTRAATKTNFDGKLASEQIFSDDFKALAALAPSSPTPAKASPTPVPKPSASVPRPAVPNAPAKKDEKPLWAGVTGKFDVDLKKIQVGADYPVSGIKGRFAITDTKFAIDTLEGKFKENPFKVTGGLTFTATQPKPYVLTATTTVSGFDVGEFLRAANPNEKPAFESTVSVAAKLDGTGINLADLLETTKGQFDVSGTTGVLRAFSKKGEVATGLLSLGLGILGERTKSQSTAAYAELVNELREVPFDSFKMRVERDAQLNLNLMALELLSPTKRITGQGKIEYQAGKAIPDQPLRVEILLAGKGGTQLLLQRAGVLSGKSDEKKYSPMAQAFVLKGTLNKPDPEEFYKLIGGAALGGLLR